MNAFKILCACLCLTPFALDKNNIKNADPSFSNTHAIISEKNYNDLDILCEMSNYVLDSKIAVVSSNFEIYGNDQTIKNEFDYLVKNGPNKIYCYYSTEFKESTTSQALVVVKTNSKTLKFNFIERYDIKKEILISEIKDFIINIPKIFNITWDSIKTPKLTRDIDPKQTFTTSIVDYYNMVRFSNRGYIDYHINVYEYVVNELSILYLLTIDSSFVPGQQASLNNLDGFGNFKSISGYVHAGCVQAFDANDAPNYGIRYGHVPYLKDYFPINSPSTVAISSSISGGVTLGYSHEVGFSKTYSVEPTVLFNYSKTYSQQDPRLDVSRSCDNTDIVQWYFEYAGNKGKVETFHIESNNMIELENSRAGLLIGDFRLLLDYKFTIKRLSRHEEYHSADLMVRAGELHSIYNFCDGMI